LCFNQIPAKGECLLHVSGLKPDKKYIFAVGAFDAQGKMVGGAIGETTRPLLASLPLPLLTTWATLLRYMDWNFLCVSQNIHPHSLMPDFMLFRWLIRQDSTALPKELVMSYGATLPFLQAQILRFQSRNKKPVLKGWLKQGRKISKQV